MFGNGYDKKIDRRVQTIFDMTAAALWLPFGPCTLSTCNSQCTLNDFTRTGKTSRTILLVVDILLSHSLQL